MIDNKSTYIHSKKTSSRKEGGKPEGRKLQMQGDGGVLHKCILLAPYILHQCCH